MSEPTILVTGGYGCIGAEAVKWFVHNTSASIVVCSRHVSDQRTDRVFYDIDRSRLRFVKADVRQQNELLEILDRYRTTHVVHMAALQTPDCNANRDLGLQINLGGTQNIIEAMKSAKIRVERFVNASSVAVYGPRAMYPEGTVPSASTPHPVNVYGVWKLAGESLARLFSEETGVPTICLRPGVLYGPGRDAGLTSTPTTALKCVALGIPYEIPFSSKQDYLFASDVGAAVGHATMKDFDGYGLYTLPSHTLDTEHFVKLITEAAKGLGLGEQCSISVGSQRVPFICDLEYAEFSADFPEVPHTPANVAIEKSLLVYLDQIRRQLLNAEDVTSAL